MDPYAQFIAAKAVRHGQAGLSRIPPLPAALFRFQHAIVKRHLRLGRGAIFANTGLGKTGMQLSFADAVERAEDARALILSPLAVAEQTVAEAEKFGIEGVAYAASQAAAKTRIVITNYDRADRFDPDAFGAVVLDESSILKSHEGQTRRELTEAFARHRFRLACTATPAPNDWTELGQHAEFLGVMSAKEMLATFFVHDGSNRAGEGSDNAGWRLKRHAEREFWAWVASWSTLVSHPRDIGFDQAGYDLPPLVRHSVVVPAEIEDGSLFPKIAGTLGERITARRDSIEARCAAAAEIVNADQDRPWLIWCNLNAEADLLERSIAGAKQVKGSDSRDLKASRLLGFVKGAPRNLITKPSLAGFGMNFQHCADMIFVGLNDSWEQIYQGVRRCWRFGQTQPVDAWFVSAEAEGAVVRNVERKDKQHMAMQAAMAEAMRDFTKAAFSGAPARPADRHLTSMELPAWLAA